MEQHDLKNINKCLNTDIYPYLETSGGQSLLNVVAPADASLHLQTQLAIAGVKP
jgi:hypothetical protein